jgi:uncharacterized membrane protein YraQ (UPF0718 family)
MTWKTEWKCLFWIFAGFLTCFYLPVGNARFDSAVIEAFYLVKWYAQEHVLLCLIPAFFIAGAIGVFVSQGAVMKYLGADANKILAYAVASVSGTILAVCSCTILPLFAGIYRMGAGLGAACAFLYSGPAINVLAIILTARILGAELGIARAIGAIGISIVIGLIMAFLFRKEEQEKIALQSTLSNETPKRHLWQNVLFFASMIGILVFANFGKPLDSTTTNMWTLLYDYKWILTAICAVALGAILILWFDKNECGEWCVSSWSFAKQIIPLLLLGVFIAGLLLGRVNEEGIIPSSWIEGLVGGNSLRANFFASLAGALMYFATLTEVPIVQGLIGAGMGNGPALSLLLAGPALSLPSIIVINSVLGTKKTAVFVGLVVVFSTACGMLFGYFYP